MAVEPEVAVVVAAYRRDRYLRDAVRSVLWQTIGRDRLELVTLKDQRRDDLDAELASVSDQLLIDPEPRVGAWLLRAVRATRAPLVAFLDDDDEFEPDRLAHVLDVFRERPDVVFYRNRVRVMDPRGVPVPVECWRGHQRDAWFDVHGPTYLPADRKAGSLAPLGAVVANASFNTSTMVVRRDLFDGPWGDEFARVRVPDLALFVLGALAPGAVYLDDRRLTRYRSSSDSLSHRVGWLAHAEESHRELGRFARARGHDALAAWLTGSADHFARLHRTGTLVEGLVGGASRREIAHQGAEYLRFLDRHPAERRLSLDVWSAPIYAVAGALVPSLARTVARRRPTRRAR